MENALELAYSLVATAQIANLPERDNPDSVWDKGDPTQRTEGRRAFLVADQGSQVGDTDPG